MPLKNIPVSMLLWLANVQTEAPGLKYPLVICSWIVWGLLFVLRQFIIGISHQVRHGNGSSGITENTFVQRDCYGMIYKGYLYNCESNTSAAKLATFVMKKMEQAPVLFFLFTI